MSETLDCRDSRKCRGPSGLLCCSPASYIRLSGAPEWDDVGMPSLLRATRWRRPWRSHCSLTLRSGETRTTSNVIVYFLVAVQNILGDKHDSEPLRNDSNCRDRPYRAWPVA